MAVQDTRQVFRVFLVCCRGLVNPFPGNVYTNADGKQMPLLDPVRAAAS